MRIRAAIASVCVLSLAACSSGPTQATPVTPTTLLASAASLALERTGTATVQATLSGTGAPTDVTAVAVWTSSNPQVAAVVAGVVTGIGPGSATITVTHAGRSVSVPVIVRRRVYLKGYVQAQDSVPRASLYIASVYINGGWASQNAMSGPTSYVPVPFGGTSASGIALAPGTHELAMQLDNLPGQYLFRFRSPADNLSPDGFVQVRDKDTGELIGTIAVPDKTEILPANGRAIWQITVGAYTS